MQITDSIKHKRSILPPH